VTLRRKEANQKAKVKNQKAKISETGRRPDWEGICAAREQANLQHCPGCPQRLERLVWDAIYALQKAGLDSEAARLRRALHKG
jgi:hypothetical protein